MVVNCNAVGPQFLQEQLELPFEHEQDQRQNQATPIHSGSVGHYRDVIDDQTIEIQHLREELRRYKRKSSDLLCEHKLFEIKIHDLSKRSKSDLETTLQDTYCSPALIRVILCLACRSLSGYDKISSFHVNLGGRLLHEAKEILHEKKNCRDGLPNAQALSLLAVHELGSHDMREALDLVEECVYMLTSLRLKEAPVDQIAILSWTSAVSTCLHGAISLAR